MISQSQLYDPTAAAGIDVELYVPQQALAAVVQMAPILVVFVAGQRYLVRGVMLGSVIFRASTRRVGEAGGDGSHNTHAVPRKD